MHTEAFEFGVLRGFRACERSKLVLYFYWDARA
jgi:hypothetical protein